MDMYKVRLFPVTSHNLDYAGEAETNQHGNEERLVMPDDAEGEKGWRCKERVTVLK